MTTSYSSIAISSYRSLGHMHPSSIMHHALSRRHQPRLAAMFGLLLYSSAGSCVLQRMLRPETPAKHRTCGSAQPEGTKSLTECSHFDELCPKVSQPMLRICLVIYGVHGALSLALCAYADIKNALHLRSQSSRMHSMRPTRHSLDEYDHQTLRINTEHSA